MDRDIIIIINDIRSCHNVGSIFRTAEGMAVNRLYLTGYSPYPKTRNDPRLPHIYEKINDKIGKTALGAEKAVAWERSDDVIKLIDHLRSQDYQICALEQSKNSIDILDIEVSGKIAVILGNEVTGVNTELLDMCDQTIEIKMLGKKESYNVVQATAMLLFRLRFLS